MSKPLNLIQNLNEIMEKYVRNEEETTQELQMIVIQEERTEARIKAETEIEQLPEGSRKRKKSKEETEEYEEADELISERAHVVMKETLMQKDFFRERGFVKLISP